MEKYDAIVVGAGISGLLSALALSKEGKKVLVLEKSGVVGGNCRTYEVGDTGYFVDTGVHAITGLKDGPLINFMDRYFSVAPKFIPHGEYYLRYNDGVMHFPNTIKGLLYFKALPKSDCIALTKIVLKAMTHLSRVEKSDLSAYEFIKGANLSEAGIRLVDTLSYFSSGLSMKETPAWRILSAGGIVHDGKRTVKKKLAEFFKLAVNKSYGEQGYPLGGIQSITDCALKSLPKNAIIKTCEEVTRIREGKDSLKIETKNNKYEAKIIIYSGMAKNLPQIADMPSVWAESTKKLRQSIGITLWLGLKKPISAFSYRGSEVWFSEGVPYWAMPISNYDPHLAPRRKQLVGFTAFLPENENPAKHGKKLLETICSAVPGIEETIEMKHMQVMVPEKAAISVGVKFPSVQTPIKNLYLVGTDADMRSMGITRAVYSVMEMLKILEYIRKA